MVAHRFFSNPLRASWLAAILMFMLPQRGARAEDALSYKFQSWQEDDGRIRVDAHYALAEKDLTPDLRFKLMGVIDVIAGASPTGQPAPAPGASVPLVFLDDRREAWQAELARQFGRVNLALGYAASRESDYISKAGSLNARIDFNQKNTTLLLGYARTDDDVQPAFFARPRAKQADDFIVGVTQLLGAHTSVTVNLTYGHTYGYLSDPYKLVQKDTEVAPGLFLPLTFAENRPDEKERLLLLLGLNHDFERLGAALDTSYRLVDDDFGTTSHTIALEWFQKLGSRVVVRPAVRFYQQSAADFYHPTLEGTDITPGLEATGHPPYYSSDYRLSRMRTVTLGLKVVWTVTDWLAVDATYERYTMRGRDGGATPASAYADADVFTVGVKLWR